MGGMNGPGWAGNAYWRNRAKDGRDKVYDDADELLEKCVEYFEWNLNNPMKSEKIVGTPPQRMDVDVPRVMSLMGLSLFIGQTSKTWCETRTNTTDPEMKAVIRWAEEIIRSNKYEGAVGGFFNAMILVRDLGLTDKSEVTNVGGGGGATVTFNVTSVPSGQFLSAEAAEAEAAEAKAAAFTTAEADVAGV